MLKLNLSENQSDTAIAQPVDTRKLTRTQSARLESYRDFLSRVIKIVVKPVQMDNVLHSQISHLMKIAEASTENSKDKTELFRIRKVRSWQLQTCWHVAVRYFIWS